jgi:flagellar motor switch protein FliG
MGARIREDYRNITGPEKSAILLMSLGEDHAAKLFSHLDDEEIKEISQVMASLGNVSSNIVERLFVEFAEQVSSTGSLVGTMDSTQRMLTKILGEDRVNDIMEEIRGPAGRTMWDKLANVNEQVLANYLKNEYPQTVAVILGKLGQQHAAKVLAILPENFAMEVVMRMLRIEAVNKDIEKDVERVLRTEFMSNLARTNRRDSHETMAEIFTHLDRATESRFLSALEERNKDSSERIRALMFTFEDLKGIDPSGIQTLLRNVDKDKLTVALKGASEELKDLFFSNMSQRAANLLREDMQAAGPVRLKEVEEAQQAMITAAKDLAERGEIVIGGGPGDDQLVF